MKIIGILLVSIAGILYGVAQALGHAGVTLIARKDRKSLHGASPGRASVLVPYTVQTRSGKRITLYDIERR